MPRCIRASAAHSTAHSTAIPSRDRSNVQDPQGAWRPGHRSVCGRHSDAHDGDSAIPRFVHGPDELVDRPGRGHPQPRAGDRAVCLGPGATDSRGDCRPLGLALCAVCRDSLGSPRAGVDPFHGYRDRPRNHARDPLCRRRRRSEFLDSDGRDRQAGTGRSPRGCIGRHQCRRVGRTVHSDPDHSALDSGPGLDGRDVVDSRPHCASDSTGEPRRACPGERRSSARFGIGSPPCSV